MKQELFERIGRLYGYGSRDYIERNEILDLVKQLDEPQPVKVKQFVADWIEHCRGLGYSLYQSMELVHENAEIKKWFIFVDNQDLFARAWLDGYEVEEEKRYYVRFKWIEEAYSYLTFIKRFDAWTLADIKLDKKFRSEHTRKELEEAGFGWVFDCPGIEIEEVE